MKTLHSSFFFLAVFCFMAVPALAAEGQLHPNKPGIEEQVKPPGAVQKLPPTSLYQDLPEEYIEEAQQYFLKCQKRPSMSQYYNCKCLATKFLDKRIELGPGVSNSSISLQIEGQCADATQAAGVEYQRCVEQAPMMPIKIPIEEYCSCYANTYAKLWEQNNASPSSQAFVHFQTQAHITCRDPDLSKRLYPNQVR